VKQRCNGNRKNADIPLRMTEQALRGEVEATAREAGPEAKKVRMESRPISPCRLGSARGGPAGVACETTTGARRPFGNAVQNAVSILDIGSLFRAEAALLQNRRTGCPKCQQGRFRYIFSVVDLPKKWKEISFDLLLEAPDAVARRELHP